MMEALHSPQKHLSFLDFFFILRRIFNRLPMTIVCNLVDWKQDIYSNFGAGTACLIVLSLNSLCEGDSNILGL
jgi:hypothetical protein